MFDKLNEMQQKLDEIKSRMDTVYVHGEAGEGKVKVIITANKLVKDIELSADLLAEKDGEQLSELIVVAVNRAMEKADEVSKSEMQEASAGLLSGLPGMFGS